MGAALGIAISPQGLAQRFTEPAADCLRRVLGAAMQRLLAAAPVDLPLLRRFAGVSLYDSTVIRLPDALAAVWPGCGGRVAAHSQAALKVQVRWELGAQPVVQDAQGRRHAHAGAFLATRPTAVVDAPVRMGAEQPVACRLVAVRVPAAVAARRRRALRRAAKREGRTPSQASLTLTGWDAFLTTAPAALLAVPEILALAGARWQVELLFKRWKQDGRVDAWRSANPWRILSEVYAKLLGVLIAHWCLLLASWADPAAAWSRRRTWCAVTPSPAPAASRTASAWRWPTWPRNCRAPAASPRAVPSPPLPNACSPSAPIRNPRERSPKIDAYWAGTRPAPTPRLPIRPIPPM